MPLGGWGEEWERVGAGEGQGGNADTSQIPSSQLHLRCDPLNLPHRPLDSYSRKPHAKDV